MLAEAHASHVSIGEHGKRQPSAAFRRDHFAASFYASALREPPLAAEAMVFDAGGLAQLRAFLTKVATGAGLSGLKLDELVFAANELGTNSIRYGGGQGLARIWREVDAIVCEFTDQGRLEEPLAGRTRPDLTQLGGRGLWLANQLCDLVQMRSLESGTVIRLFKRF